MKLWTTLMLWVWGVMHLLRGFDLFGFTSHPHQPIQAWLIDTQKSCLNCFLSQRGGKKTKMQRKWVEFWLATEQTLHLLMVLSIICVGLSVNWRLADWFSFLTRSVERQFNFLSSRLPGRLFFYFILFLCSALQKMSTRLCQCRAHSLPWQISPDPNLWSAPRRTHVPPAQYEYIIIPNRPVFNIQELYWRLCWKFKHLNKTKGFCLDARDRSWWKTRGTRMKNRGFVEYSKTSSRPHMFRFRS